MKQKLITELKDREYKEGIVYGEGSCRDMIMSCLTYGTTKDYFMKKYAPNYVKHEESWVNKNGSVKRTKEGIFDTITDVEKIWDDQEDYFRNHCRVNHDVYTDSEGLSYNSVTEF